MNVQENPLRKLKQFGQTVWLDLLSRDLIQSGRLKDFVERDGVGGVTSNPSIFDKAIVHSSSYDTAIGRASAARSESGREIYEELAITDIQAAADVLRPVYEKTGGTDGYVSLEVSPDLARDTAKTIDEAMRLWRRVARPNAMIKIPGTREGLDAIARSIAEGININVTLLFALDRYREVAEAYMRGLEERVRRGDPIGGIRSVASFFLSRIDVLIDPQLGEIEKQSIENAAAARGLRGQAAIASAKLAYEMYQEMFSRERFHRLELKGARKQWLLWASTGTKSKEYSDVKYVEALIGPETVNTVPLETLEAYREHGSPARRLDADIESARIVMRELDRIGIDIDAVTSRLEIEGLEKFVAAFQDLLHGIEAKAQAVKAA